MDLFARLFIVSFLTALAIYFFRKNLLNEGLTALYTLFIIVIAAIREILLIAATIVGGEVGVYIFRVTLIGPPLLALLALLFIELLLYGKNNYFRHIPIYILLGVFIGKIPAMKIELLGKGLERDYTYVPPIESTIYYLAISLLFISYSTMLLVRISKRYKRGLGSRFAQMILLTNAIIAINMLLISATIAFDINIASERELFAIIGLALLTLAILTIAFYPRALALAPIKLYSIQIFETGSKIELYSISLTDESPKTNMQLVNQFISAMITFAKEALRGGYIRTIEMEKVYLYIETSKHFIAAAIAEEYHYNVKIVLKNILNKTEKLIRERKDLQKQLTNHVIEVEKWKEVLENMIKKEVFPI